MTLRIQLSTRPSACLSWAVCLTGTTAAHFGMGTTGTSWQLCGPVQQAVYVEGMDVLPLPQQPGKLVCLARQPAGVLTARGEAIHPCLNSPSQQRTSGAVTVAAAAAARGAAWVCSLVSLVVCGPPHLRLGLHVRGGFQVCL
jgi:hypothetical protein